MKCLYSDFKGLSMTTYDWLSKDILCSSTLIEDGTLGLLPVNKRPDEKLLCLCAVKLQ